VSGTCVWAVVPVKCFTRAKSRLGEVLSEAARADLARALCDHALTVLASCPRVDGVVVATDCTLVERFAESRGALVVRDVTVGSLARIVDHALDALTVRGASAALVLMADLPLLTVADIDALVSALDRAPVVLAPDRGETGTNALALSPPDRLATCFGSEVSFSRHLARARSARIPVAVHRSEGLAFDLDSPADLARARDYADRGALLSWNRKRPSRVRAA
jgi:2-phospho-L-lactate guanylyltransferase